MNGGDLIIAAAIALLAALVWLANLTLPYAQAVRVRNAFLLRRGRPQDFSWTPAAVPEDFRSERMRAPTAIEDAVEAAGVGKLLADWQRALALVQMLVQHSQHEGGIRADLATTFKGIVAGYGYCADYVRVYLAAARSAGLFCRQWAFSFDGFGGHGHTVVEIYDRDRARWALLDVHNNVYAVLTGTETPVDALALRSALIADPASIEFRRAAPGRLGFPHFDKLLDYYRRGANEWYLWWGNDVISRERLGLLRTLSGRLAHRLDSILGRLPSLMIFATPENERAIARMEALRRRVVMAAVSSLALAAVLAGQLCWQVLARSHG
ncbi:MAG: transglutaminase domain-containing protein [Casimicrobiaceae bacterium]